MDQIWDVVVVGAGAAGLMAAIRAAEGGRRPLLVEKNRQPGVKILMSGGTRCNLTQATDNRGIIAAFGPPGRFLHSALAAFSVQDTIDLFEAEGVATKVESSGKVFPVSNKAADVLDALVRRLERSGCTLALDEGLHDLQAEGDRFRLVTSRRTLDAGRVIVTTGGQSYPGSGTTGDGYRWASQLGHSIVAPRPALTPIIVEAPWVRALRGVTIPDVDVRVIEPSVGAVGNAAATECDSQPRLLDERRGSVLFTHFGLSGPAILDISRAVSGHERPALLSLECDFLPAISRSGFEEWLREKVGSAGKKSLLAILPEELPRRLAESLLAVAGLAADRKAAELTRGERSRVAAAIKHVSLPVTCTLGFKKAEVTAGGIALAQVDSRSMQSKLVPGLYLAGEVLDLDGPIGGYNFQAAWSTGWLAGASVCE